MAATAHLHRLEKREDGRDLELLKEAHKLSCHRDNPSSIAVLLASRSDGHPVNVLIAALATLGDRSGHAAIVPAWELLDEATPIPSGGIVAGFGNGFVKGRQDEIWLGLENHLAEANGPFYRRAKTIEGWPEPGAASGRSS
jgi:hypothetical protein